MRIGIVGYGRMGHALAGRLSEKFEVCVSDIKKDVMSQPDIRFMDNKTLFSTCKYIILCLNSENVGEAIQENKKYCKKETYLFNIITDYNTEQLKNDVSDCPSIQVIGAKILGQYIAIEKKMTVVVVTDAVERHLFDKVQLVFSTFAIVIREKEEMVKEFNHRITKKAISILLSEYQAGKMQSMDEEIYMTAVKAVLIGTVEEFDIHTSNSYIQKIVNEIKEGYDNEG